MNYSDLLASLLPRGPYDTTAPVLNTFIKAIGSQLDVQDANGVSLLNNIIPGTADMNGIDIWEKILDLPSDPTLTLVQRQQRCAAMAIRTPGVLGYSNLLAILNSFSKLKRAQIIQDPAAYSLVCIVAVEAQEISDYEQIARTVFRFLPAHLSCEIDINYIHTLDISVAFNFWVSDVLSKCGTLQSGGDTWIATTGRTLKHLLQLTKTSWLSEIIARASTALMVQNDQGRRFKNLFTLSKASWQSDIISVASPSTEPTSTAGRKWSFLMAQATFKYYSTPYASCGTVATGEGVTT